MKSLKNFINEGFKLGKNKVKKEKDWIDLDLPSGTLWCKYNVGATCASTAKSWYGDYFMWGDTEPVTDKKCIPKNYKYYNKSNKNTFTKYCPTDKTNYWCGTGAPDNKLVLDEEDDMAKANMGDNWKMPTEEQFQELIDNTTNEWVTDYNGISGLNGKLFTSKSNDNTLFIPAAGFHGGSSITSTNYSFCLWSSTLNVDCPSHVYALYGHNSFIEISSDYRISGFSVRGIINKLY